MPYLLFAVGIIFFLHVARQDTLGFACDCLIHAGNMGQTITESNFPYSASLEILLI